ncbi:aldo/keto reductase [Agrobacterium sp. NPDC090283]|uniref:aldo/keto reductase n=1 Tax=Agrobacterium sp. NPDC090283 TaxID=3363920 RepID=UPI00383A45B1
MEKRRLGRTAIHVAPIIFGGNVFGWTSDERTSFRLLDAFFDAGFNTIDTADVYSAWVNGNVGGESEAIIGKWLRQNKLKRSQSVIITKVGIENRGKKTGLSAGWIVQAVDASLKRLQTDYIDLYLAHKPDSDVAIEETLEAFGRLKEQGKVRAIGCSNYNVTQLRESMDAATRCNLGRFDVLQPAYNLYDRTEFEGQLSEFCTLNDIAVVTYYSLAAGFLTGKYRTTASLKGSERSNRVSSYVNERGLRILHAMDEISKETGAQLAEIALAWLLKKDAVTAPIASATSLVQLQSFERAMRLVLTNDMMTLLDQTGS